METKQQQAAAAAVAASHTKPQARRTQAKCFAFERKSSVHIGAAAAAVVAGNARFIVVCVSVLAA